MKVYEVPLCIIHALQGRDLTRADNHLFAAGRALTWMRMAADAVRATQDLKIAEYHTYTGISAARSSVDGTANWLRVLFLPGAKTGTSVDLAKEEFRQKLRPHISPAILTHLETLGEIITMEINIWRQRAQHREGVQPILRGDGAWYVALLGYAAPHTEHVRLPDLLQGWADDTERQMCAILTDRNLATGADDAAQ